MTIEGVVNGTKVQIHKTGRKIEVEDGRRHMIRAEYVDDNGNSWVRLLGQFYILNWSNTVMIGSCSDKVA